MLITTYRKKTSYFQLFLRSSKLFHPFSYFLPSLNSIYLISKYPFCHLYPLNRDIRYIERTAYSLDRNSDLLESRKARVWHTDGDGNGVRGDLVIWRYICLE